MSYCIRKKETYQSNEKIGINKIYLGEELIYEEDIYIIQPVNVNNIFDWIEEQQDNFGNQFLLEPVNEIEIDKQKNLQNTIELL